MLGGGCSGIPAHFPLLRHVATFSFLNSSTLLTHINKFIKMFKLLGKSQLEKAVLVLTLLLLAAGHQCGNGLKERGENCDDGNAQSQDGCDSRCWIEQGYHCPIPGARCLQAAVCGDEKQDFPTEQCDDGNQNDGDGCSSACQLEPGFFCRRTRCVRLCGDGVIRTFPVQARE